MSIPSSLISSIIALTIKLNLVKMFILNSGYSSIYSKFLEVKKDNTSAKDSLLLINPKSNE